MRKKWENTEENELISETDQRKNRANKSPKQSTFIKLSTIMISVRNVATSWKLITKEYVFFCFMGHLHIFVKELDIG